MLDLPINQVHLWLVQPDEIRDDLLLSRYRELLTDQERAQETRFKYPKDQRQYLVTRALVRTVLSKYSFIEPHEWRFARGAHGKPVAAAPRRAYIPCFNVSHTSGLIICGVVDSRRVGVDAESVRRTRIPVDIADQYFSPAEVVGLRSLPRGVQELRFLEYWTLKESYIKADGRGLAIPLQQFGFDLSRRDQVEISFQRPLKDRAARWKFWLLRPTADHLATVCAERCELVSRLLVRKLIPLASDQPHDCLVLRQSEERPTADVSFDGESESPFGRNGLSQP